MFRTLTIHAGKELFNIPSKIQFIHFAAFIQCTHENNTKI